MRNKIQYEIDQLTDKILSLKIEQKAEIDFYLNALRAKKEELKEYEQAEKQKTMKLLF